MCIDPEIVNPNSSHIPECQSINESDPNRQDTQHKAKGKKCGKSSQKKIIFPRSCNSIVPGLH